MDRPIPVTSKGANRLELSDFTYSYPQIGPGIQAGLSMKYEFKELAASIEEKIIPGKYFPHQQWVITFMQHYSRLLLIFATGSGKTCAFGGSADSYIQNFAEGMLDYIDMYISPNRTNIRRVFVLVKNKLLKDNFRRQMVCVCARSNRYQTEKYRKATTEQERYRAIVESLNRYFSLKTYHGFSKMVVKLKGENPEWKDFEQAVIQTYSNCYFIIDEAQNLRIRDTSSVFDDIQAKREKKKQDKIETYRNIHYVLQTAKQIRIIVATATPMYDKVHEIRSIMNLVLPPDNQIPESINFATVPLDQIVKYFLGYVSFVSRASNTAEPEYIGVPIYGDIVVGGQRQNLEGVAFPLIMGQYQQVGYLNAIKTEKHAYSQSRQATALVYPPANLDLPVTPYRDDILLPSGLSIGIQVGDPPIFNPNVPNNPPLSATEGFSHFIRMETRDDTKIYIPDPNFLEILGRETIDLRFPNDPEALTPRYRLTLQDVAIKYKAIIDDLREDIRSGHPKVTFIFDEFVAGSGAMVLSYVLSQYGFDEFVETSSIFIEESGKNVGGACGMTPIQPFGQSERDLSRPGEEILPITPTGIEQRITERMVRPNFQKSGQNGVRYRYVLLRHKITTAEQDAIFKVIQSYENRYGQYILIIIATPLAREGINTANVGKYYQVSWPWDEQRVKQGLSRTIRADSHIYILEEMKEKARREGMSEAEIEKLKAKVLVYQYAGVMPYNLIYPQYPQVVMRLDVEDNRGTRYRQQLDLKTGNNQWYTIGYDQSRQDFFLRESNGPDLGLEIIGRPGFPRELTVIGHQIRSAYYDNSGGLVLFPERQEHPPETRHPYVLLRDPNGFYDLYGSDDLLMIQNILSKQVEIERINNFLYQIAVDCYSHRERNRDPETGAYVDCYEGSLIEKGQTDYSSFMILYSNSLNHAIWKFTERLFSVCFEVTWTQLYQLIQNAIRPSLKDPSVYIFEDYPIKQTEVLSPKFIQLAIVKMITQKATVINRFGIRSFLRSNRHNLFLQNEYPIGLVSDQLNLFYNQNLLGLNVPNYQVYLEDISSKLRPELTDEFISNPTMEGWRNLSINRVAIFEETFAKVFRWNLMNKADPKLTPTFNLDNYHRIIDFAKYALFQIRENSQQITEQVNLLNSEKRGEIDFFEDPNGNLVYAHTLNTYTAGTGKWSRVRKIMLAGGKEIIASYNPRGQSPIRIFRVPQNVSGMSQDEINQLRWINPSKAEIEFYRQVITKRNMLRRQPWEETPQLGFYGIYDSTNGIFLIQDKSAAETIRTSRGSVDSRKEYYGKKCTSYEGSDLIGFLWSLGIAPPAYLQINVEDKSRTDLISFIRKKRPETTSIPLEDWDDIRLIFVYRWVHSSNDDICSQLFDYMSSHQFTDQTGRSYPLIFPL